MKGNKFSISKGSWYCKPEGKLSQPSRRSIVLSRDSDRHENAHSREEYRKDYIATRYPPEERRGKGNSDDDAAHLGLRERQDYALKQKTPNKN